MNGRVATLGDLGSLRAEGAETELAHAHRPLLRLDDAEPFPPLAAGFAIYRETAQSVSSKFQIEPVADCVIEYAIWYDWDIQHLYDLEHVWLHLDAYGQVVQVEASRHGSRLVMQRPDGALPVEAGRPVLFLEPGKHAHWADGETMRLEAGERIDEMCGALAGQRGIHLSNRFSDAGLFHATEEQDQLARTQLQNWRFAPSWSFTRTSDDIGDYRLVPWPALEAWVPTRVKHLISELLKHDIDSLSFQQSQAET